MVEVGIQPSFWRLFGFVGVSVVVRFYAEDKLPGQDFVIECCVQQAVRTLVCLKHGFSMGYSETQLGSLQSLHAGRVQGVQRVSENAWAAELRT